MSEMALSRLVRYKILIGAKIWKYHTGLNVLLIWGTKMTRSTMDDKAQYNDHEVITL